MKARKVREIANRIFSGNLLGMKLIVPNDGRSPYGNEKLELRFYSGEIAWFKNSLSENFILIYAPDILDWEVVGISTQQLNIIEDGDSIYVNGKDYYGISKIIKAKVITVSEEDSNLYPIKVEFPDGRHGQYKREDIKCLVKAENKERKWQK